MYQFYNVYNNKYKDTFLFAFMLIVCLLVKADPATSYLRAARSGNLEKVLLLLENSGVDVNTANAVSICFYLFFEIYYIFFICLC